MREGIAAGRVATLSMVGALVLTGSACSDRGDGGPPDPAGGAPLVGAVAAGAEPTAVPVDTVTGEVIYVPVYSSIFHQDSRRTLELTATLSIHNTDATERITLRGVRYHDLAGRQVRRFLETERVLEPLETVNFVVEERDRSGGTGAKFIVEWVAATSVSRPIVEAVMIGTSSTQGISFVTTGKVIRRLDPATEREGAPSPAP